MSTQATPHYRAQRSMRSLSDRARHSRFGTLGALCLLTLLFAIGCGGGGGGASSTNEVAVIATTPIDLPPGQTTARLAWAPSEGQVVGYLVFQPRGEEDFEFLDRVIEPEIQITAAAGDSIRILVVAEGVASLRSVASHPSPPIRFHAAVEAVSALAASSAEAPAPTATSLSTSTIDTQLQPADSEPSPPGDEALSEADSNDANGPDDEVALLDRAARERLLRADARPPFRGLSPNASRWIQSFVDAQVGAGVSLAGLGDLDGDALREPIWIDSSGQLFVSDGARIVATEDLPSTFVEAIRLRPTERFIGLVDLDGDGVGDWIVEDTATGDVWILNEESQDAQFALITPLNPDLRLVGHGDFDGDGRAELLWQHTDSSFQLGPPTDAPAVVEWILPEDDSDDATHTTGQLLTVADLNGDGRDDLLFRGSDGFLDLALSLAISSGVRFEWMPGPEITTDGLELVATLDLDLDGAAEIVWWHDEALEIWELQNGL